MILVALLGCLTKAQVTVIVDTEYGQVEGNFLANVYNGEFSADVNAFHAIPFAKSTAAARRFRVNMTFLYLIHHIIKNYCQLCMTCAQINVYLVCIQIIIIGHIVLFYIKL